MLKKLIPDENYSLLRRLLSENFKSQLNWYLIAVASMIVVAATTAFSAWIMRDVVNQTVVVKDYQKTLEIAFLIIVIFTIKGVATYVQTLFLSKAGNNIIAETQRKIYNHILSQSVRFYSKYPTSQILVRVTNNAQSARNVIDLLVTSFVRDLFTLVGLAIVMFMQQPILSLISLVAGPIAIIGVRSLTLQIREVMKQEIASLGKIISNVQETSTGIRVIKAYDLESRMSELMDANIKDVERRANAIAKIQAISSPLMETISGFAIAGVVAISAFWIKEGQNAPGEMMSFITALLLAYEPAKRLARVRIGLETGIVGVRMMYELLDHPSDLVEAENAIDLPKGKGEIQFSDVGFSYKSSQPIFKELNLTFTAGKTTALVGPSGGGKSTIINLIMRLYDPKKGSVSIDGYDLKTITFQSLRKRIAYVGQDTFLFTGTIKYNISLGRESSTDEEIIEAAKAANAHEFIMKLPKGYETHVEENGGNFSGGQRQRISIARAMLRDAEILILDEATSALDSESESLIKEAIERLSAGRTTIMIAHRLSSISAADMIVVMEAGEVVESGTQSELLLHDGPFRKLYELQLLPGFVSMDG